MKSASKLETVLVLTAHKDLTADAVIGELNRRGASVARMDTGDFPIRSQLAATISATGVEGRLCTSDVEVDLGSVGSIYYRRPTRFRFPDALSGADRVLAATEARFGFGGVLGAPDALWINHPARLISSSPQTTNGSCWNAIRQASGCGSRTKLAWRSRRASPIS